MPIDFRSAAAARRLLHGSIATLLLATAGPAAAHDSLTEFGLAWDRGGLNVNVGTGAGVSKTVLPWVRKYYSSAGNCLHLEIRQVSPAADLEMIVIPPDVGERYRDDNSSAVCANCPRVNIASTPAAGYYTVIVTHATGALTNADFVIEALRAPAGAAACSPATPPLATPRKAKGSGQPDLSQVSAEDVVD